jgi:hypothetical protein
LTRFISATKAHVDAGTTLHHLDADLVPRPSDAKTLPPGEGGKAPPGGADKSNVRKPLRKQQVEFYTKLATEALQAAVLP